MTFQNGPIWKTWGLRVLFGSGRFESRSRNLKSFSGGNGLFFCHVLINWTSFCPNNFLISDTEFSPTFVEKHCLKGPNYGEPSTFWDFNQRKVYILQSNISMAVLQTVLTRTLIATNIGESLFLSKKNWREIPITHWVRGCSSFSKVSRGKSIHKWKRVIPMWQDRCPHSWRHWPGTGTRRRGIAMAIQTFASVWTNVNSFGVSRRSPVFRIFVKNNHTQMFNLNTSVMSTPRHKPFTKLLESQRFSCGRGITSGRKTLHSAGTLAGCLMTFPAPSPTRLGSAGKLKSEWGSSQEYSVQNRVSDWWPDKHFAFGWGRQALFANYDPGNMWSFTNLRTQAQTQSLVSQPLEVGFQFLVTTSFAVPVPVSIICFFFWGGDWEHHMPATPVLITLPTGLLAQQDSAPWANVTFRRKHAGFFKTTLFSFCSRKQIFLQSPRKVPICFFSKTLSDCLPWKDCSESLDVILCHAINRCFDAVFSCVETS